MTIPLTKDEAAKFLTSADLARLLRLAEDGMLQADAPTGPSRPCVIVRNQYIPLFTVLELLGTV